MRTIALSDARANLKRVADQTIEDADVTLLTRRDAENMILMSQGHYDSLMETVYLLRPPANAVHLARSIAQMRAGDVTFHGLIEDSE